MTSRVTISVLLLGLVVSVPSPTLADGRRGLRASSGRAIVERLGQLDHGRKTHKRVRNNPVKGVELMMRAPLETIASVAKLGFLNMFQAGATGSEHGVRLLERVVAERQIAAKNDLPFYPLSSRVRYGYLNVKGAKGRLPDPTQYGEVTFIFRPEVGARASFLMGDSLHLAAGGFHGKMYRPRPLSDHDTLQRVLRGFRYQPRLDRGNGFVEAQIHGHQLSLRDVEAVIMPTSVPDRMVTFGQMQSRAPELSKVRKQLLKLAKRYHFDVYDELPAPWDRPQDPSQKQTSPSGRQRIYRSPRRTPVAEPFKAPTTAKLLTQARKEAKNPEALIPLMTAIAERATTKSERAKAFRFIKGKLSGRQCTAVRQFAALALGQLAAEKTVAALKAALKDEKSEVRQAAMIALGNQPMSPRLGAFFAKLATRTTDPMLRPLLAMTLAEMPEDALSPAERSAALLKLVRAAAKKKPRSPNAFTAAGWTLSLAFEGALTRGDLKTARSLKALLPRFGYTRSDVTAQRKLMDAALVAVKADKRPTLFSDEFRFVEWLHHWAPEGAY